jgi:hypothetical protein
MTDVADEGGYGRQWMVGDWLDAAALATLREINAQCVELVCARGGVGPRRGPADGVRYDLPSLAADARRQLAGCPYLLVDAGFADEARWAAHARGAFDSARAIAAPPFAGEEGVAFVRRVLTYGWYLARSHRQLARLVLGMTPACAARIAALRLEDLDAIVARQPGWVRLRWEGEPRVWGQLIAAARGTDDAALRRLSLRGLQLLASAVLPPPSK